MTWSRPIGELCLQTAFEVSNLNEPSLVSETVQKGKVNLEWIFCLLYASQEDLGSAHHHHSQLAQFFLKTQQNSPKLRSLQLWWWVEKKRCLLAGSFVHSFIRFSTRIILVCLFLFSTSLFRRLIESQLPQIKENEKQFTPTLKLH